MRHVTNPANVVLLALIVLAFLVIGALYATKTPAWQVPDEPAHYNYVAQVARNGCCPTLQMGDWDNDYLNAIKAAKFSPESINGRLDTIRYEDHQPPLYYLLAALVYNATGGSLTDLRLFSLIFGAGVVIMAWAAVMVAFPEQPRLALATAAFVAFVPQHVAMMAGVENDGLAEMVMGLILVVSIGYLRGRIHPVVLGILLGLAFVIKLTIYFPAIAVIGLALLFYARRQRSGLLHLIRHGLWIAIPALALGGILWIRNVSVYGDVGDIVGQKIQDRVVVGQTRTSDYIASPAPGSSTPRGIVGWLRDGVQVTFQSFWGQFGWMGVIMTDRIYQALLAFTLFVILGAAIAFVRWRNALNAVQHETLILFAACAFMALVETVGYNLQFVQFQGRYLYPGLIPIGLFFACGLVGWTSLLSSLLPRQPRITAVINWLPLVIVCLFASFDVYALYRIILPALT